MLQVVNSAIQTILAAASAQLGAIKIQTGNCESVGATSFMLNKPGFYLVNVTGSIGGLTNTGVRLALVNNTTNAIEQGGTVDIEGLTAGGTQTIPFSINTVVQVPKGCGCVHNAKSMSIRNLSNTPITVRNINTVVTRLA